MSYDHLPHKDSADIKLVVATPQEHLSEQEANSVEWRGNLSKEAYIRREELLYDQDLTRNGGLTPWLLVYEPRDGPRQILCSCESINKLVLIAKTGSVHDAVAHGVASVFCSTEFRGRGYAGRMMDELSRRLKKWQMKNDEPSGMSILFSDIGKKFYSARGWQPFPSAHVSLPVNRTNAELTTGMLPSRVLGPEDLPALCSADEQLMRYRLANRPTSNRTAVALVPDARTMAWHHAREGFVGKETYGRAPVDVGAIVGETQGSRVWCYWTRVWANPNENEPNTMHILRLVVENETNPSSSESDSPTPTVVKSIATLLAKAQSVAGEWGMDQVQLWNPSSTTMAAVMSLEPSCEIEERETSSIASLLWYGEESWEEIDWMWNEKYGWC